MIETFFTSDHHFGHKNILEYEKEARPFATLEEMHEVMIERWNSVVTKNDIVYHLGDFCFGKHNISIASRLNGKKRIILGNHDTYDSKLYLEYFDKLYGCVFWRQCVLSHMPININGLGARWKLNLHGHLHSKRVQTEHYELYQLQTDDGPKNMHIYVGLHEDSHYFNVSVEQNNLTPIHSDIIMERLKEL